MARKAPHANLIDDDVRYTYLSDIAHEQGDKPYNWQASTTSSASRESTLSAAVESFFSASLSTARGRTRYAVADAMDGLWHLYRANKKDKTFTDAFALCMAGFLDQITKEQTPRKKS